MRSGKATDILKKKGLVCENGKTWKKRKPIHLVFISSKYEFV